MPTIPVPRERTFVNKETVTVDGDDVEIYTYAEEYRHSWSVIRGLFGFDKFYCRRHMRAETPEYYHSRESEDVPYEEQKKQLIERVQSRKQKKQDLAERVM
jgi:hypothetical protein